MFRRVARCLSTLPLVLLAACAAEPDAAGSVDAALLPDAVWTHTGSVVNGGLGQWVGGAGDINNDGYDELLVLEAGYDDGSGELGALHLFRGSAAGVESAPDWTISGPDVATPLGTIAQATGAGDVNGDGLDDVIVGQFNTAAQPGRGRARLFFAAAFGLPATPGWEVASEQLGGRFGWSVAGIGDIDGDGYDDVAVGEPHWDDGSGESVGRVHVFRGGVTGPSNTAHRIYEGTVTSGFGSELGHSIAAAGDVNDDGYDDLVVGAPTVSLQESFSGAVYVYFGSATGLPATADVTLSGTRNRDRLGRAVAAAGDTDGDGYQDIVVGSYQYENNQDAEGKVWVFGGSPTGPSQLLFAKESNIEEGHYGRSVAGVGDLNDDGYDDIVAGAPRGPGRAGWMWVHLGSPTGSRGEPSDEREGMAASQYGTSVAALGDVDGDGTPEFAVGAPLWGGGGNATGKAFVYTGTDDWDEDGEPGATDCADWDPDIYPGAPEVPSDGIDQDCNGVDAARCYEDDDGDGYGDRPTIGLDGTCGAPGVVSRSGDCDDTEPTTNPAAPEVCDTVDNDCDPDTAYGTGPGWPWLEGRYLLDIEPDRFWGILWRPSRAMAVETLEAYVRHDGGLDLTWGMYEVGDDGTDLIWSGRTRAEERSTGQGDILESPHVGRVMRPDRVYIVGLHWTGGQAELSTAAVTRPQTFWEGTVGLAVRADGPGLPEPRDLEENVSMPGIRPIFGGTGDADGDGWAACGDCDDRDPAVTPESEELCDGLDTNCDGDGPGEFDADGDGSWNCDDCDEERADTAPGLPELCDGVDNDCDGDVPQDERDADGDDWKACEGDCEDGDADSNPAGSEEVAAVCSDGLDNDCDELIDLDDPACRAAAGCYCDAAPAKARPGSVLAVLLGALLLGTRRARRRRPPLFGALCLLLLPAPASAAKIQCPAGARVVELGDALQTRGCVFGSRDPVRQGPWETSWPDGTRRSRCTYVDDRPDGECTWWAENGRKQRTITFKDGRPAGPFAVYSDTGEVLLEGTARDGRIEGAAVQRGLDGEIRIDARFSGGLRVGKWRLFHPGGELRAEGRFEDDRVQDGWSCWDADGNPGTVHPEPVRSGERVDRLERWLEFGGLIEDPILCAVDGARERCEDAASASKPTKRQARSCAQAVRQHPDDPLVHFWFGRVLEAADEPDKAAKAFAYAAKLDPENPKYRGRAAINAFKADRHAAAIAHWDAAERIESGYLDAHPSEKQAYEEAEEQLKRSGSADDERRARGAVGSGFLLNDVSEAVTASHVVEECSRIRVRTQDQEWHEADVVARDRTNDLAVLRLEPQSHGVLALRGDPPLRAGEDVVAMGFPLAGLMGKDPIVSTGIVNSLSGIADDARWIQISAQIQGGSSGGPLLDRWGHVVGIVVATLDAARFFDAVGELPQDINFAVKASMLKIFLESNGVAYTTEDSGEELSTADIADLGRKASIFVECTP